MSDEAAFYVLDPIRGRRIGHLRQTTAGRWSTVAFVEDETSTLLGHHLERKTAAKAVLLAYEEQTGETAFLPAVLERIAPAGLDAEAF